jgi:hypothetical protein
VLQLEYRADHPGEHYQALTKSRAQVSVALRGWSRGDTAWRNDFEWLAIGDWFIQ